MNNFSTQSVQDMCKNFLDHPELLKGYNLFVQQVCASFGYKSLFSKGDNAYVMIAKLTSEPFIDLKMDKEKAAELADEGYLVLSSRAKFTVNSVPKPFIKDRISSSSAAPFVATKRRQRYLACSQTISIRLSSGL